MTDTELVHLAIDGGIATVTLDSPHNRNALSRRLITELTDHLRTAGADGDVRAVVLTHTGTTFCAGADLAEASTGPMTGTASGLLALLRVIVELPRPVIASIDGNVRAGGIGLLGACDIVVAGRRSTFAITEARLGLRGGGHLGDRAAPTSTSAPRRATTSPARPSTPPRRNASAWSRSRPTTSTALSEPSPPTCAWHHPRDSSS